MTDESRPADEASGPDVGSTETEVADRGPAAGVSRRTFLRGTAAGGAAAVVAPALAGAGEAGAEAGAQLQIDEVVGNEPRVPIVLRVNGRRFRLSVEPRWTLLDVLRDRLDLTGTKQVCDRGECGACTVLRDGTPVNACLTLAIEAQDCEITTVEGLTKDGRLHPIQQAFIDNDSMQCGFCTPGMVVTLSALLADNPSPTEEDVRRAISGNLCKCATYPNIFRAAKDAAAMMTATGAAASAVPGNEAATTAEAATAAAATGASAPDRSARLSAHPTGKEG
jgi:aerobic-type carbon monoxide dehydrogenase small subunit (CoxS/CutS family)